MSVKAFDLVPAVDRDLLMGDQGGVSIECVECCGRRLYVGTSDGFLHHFLLVEAPTSCGEAGPSFSCQKLLHRHLGQRRPAAELHAASALQRLLVLCGDGLLFLADMVTLETVPPAAAAGPGGGARIRGVTAFCVNENPVTGKPFCVEIAVLTAKRRSVQVFLVLEDRVQLLKEVPTPEQPCALSVDGYFLCIALASRYVIVNYESGASQDLFPFNSEQRRPIVKRIGREEFLLAAPGGLGMFANSSGASQRAPVSWSEGVVGAAVCFPYVLALDQSFVTVHSMLDQQTKQSLAFRDGVLLQAYEGKVMVASSKAVYVLFPLPVEKQIQDLLSSQRVEEALLLTEGVRVNVPRDRFQVLQRRVLQQAGFIQFSRLQFQEARDNFRKGDLDVRELISLYPLLLPSSSSFARCHPPLHQFADLHHLAQGDRQKEERCKSFIITYLAELRSSEASNGFREEIDTALLKLYAEYDHHAHNDTNHHHDVNHDHHDLHPDHPDHHPDHHDHHPDHPDHQAALLRLLETPNSCLLEDSAPWLQRHHRYFALGQLYHSNGQDAAALQLWQGVVDGSLQDSSVPDLFLHIVDFLRSANQELLWKHADWTLRKDPTRGVAIFTRRCGSSPAPDPHRVVDFLENHGDALMTYLEHLVMEEHNQEEVFHTRLLLLYVERVKVLLEEKPRDQETLKEKRSRLQRMLRDSQYYTTDIILGHVDSSEDLLLERALLLGRLEDHEAALELLVRRLRDFGAAESYVLWASSGRDSAYSRRLFHLLLAAYLQDGEMEMEAVELLNRHGHRLDAVSVLQSVPDHWSLAIISPFLRRALRSSVHDARTAHIAVRMAEAENSQLLQDRFLCCRRPVLVSEKKGCCFCHNTFTEPSIVCLPGGVPVHTHCAAQRLQEPGGGAGGGGGARGARGQEEGKT